LRFRLRRAARRPQHARGPRRALHDRETRPDQHLQNRLRKALYALGLKPTAPHTPKVEVPAAITALAEKRWAAKQAKDFAAADALRQELAAAGWSMLDSKTDYKLEPLKK
jgi:cysteinyl-tRNA synthetase